MTPRRAAKCTPRRVGSTLVAILALALTGAAVEAVPASAVLVAANGHVYGVTPIKGVRVAGALHIRRARPHADELPGGGSLLESFGGPVMHGVTTHVIYWDPREEFTTTTKEIVEHFFSNVAADSGQPANVFAIAGQYTDSTGHAAYNYTALTPILDSDAYPPKKCNAAVGGDPGPPYKNCITDAQLQAEVSNAITAHGLETGPEQLYFVLLPHTVVSCFSAGHCSNNEFCAYHGVINGGNPNEVIYAEIPFSLLDSADAKGCQADKNEAIQLPNGDSAGSDESTRYADVALKYISHEDIEAATDPVPGTGWLDSAFPESLEIGDKCNSVPYTPEEEGEPGFDLNAFTPTLGGEAAKGTLYNQEIHSAHYYLQSEWDNAAEACIMRPLPLSGAGFVHSPIKPLEGESVKFTGGITDRYGDPEFSWKFGDGSEGAGEKPTHVYATKGNYKVVMSVKDGLTGSTVAPQESTITVDEPPAAEFSVAEPTTAKSEVKFNASASSDPDGTIAKYKWQFGDGTSKELATATTEHSYKPGEYLVTLTVEDSEGFTASKQRKIRVVDAPTLTTEAASSIGQTSATLNASIDPNGATQEECWIEYGEKEAKGGTKLPCAPGPGNGFGVVAVSATVSGLKPNTHYQFRIFARDSVGATETAEQGFSTLPKLPPTVNEETASSVTSSGAVLGALVNPRGAVVEQCKFEYGTTVFYEASVPCAVLPGGGASNVAVSAPVGSLAANTTYHFRIVAASNAGAAEGSDATFKTAPAVKEPGKTPPNSSFVAKASGNASSGAIAISLSVANPGRLSWLATFANGKFGVFASRASKCKKGFLKLGGRCRPATIVFARGSTTVTAAGSVRLTLKPTSSARKALVNARKRHKGLAVTVRLTFQSSLGGAPASSTISLTVKLKK